MACGTTPACTDPGGSLGRLNFPDHWTSPLPNGFVTTPATHIASSFVGYIKAGLTFIGGDVFTVLLPFLVGITLIMYVLDSFGITGKWLMETPEDTGPVNLTSGSGGK